MCHCCRQPYHLRQKCPARISVCGKYSKPCYWTKACKPKCKTNSDQCSPNYQAAIPKTPTFYNGIRGKSTCKLKHRSDEDDTFAITVIENRSLETRFWE